MIYICVRLLSQYLFISERFLYEIIKTLLINNKNKNE